MALCAAPLLLALAASASTSTDDNPAPSPDSADGSGVAAPTQYPNPTIGYKETPAPADTEEVVTEEEEGTPVTEEEDKEGTVTSTMGDDEGTTSMTGEKETPMDTPPADGDICTTYDEDVSVLIQIWPLCFRRGGD